VHVEDVARANELALLGDRPHDGALNVASGSPITLAEMAAVLAGADGAGRTPEVTGRYRIGDVRHVVGDPAGAERALGFRARIAPDEGLVRFASDPLRRPPRTS
jgi:dTDP-L-rhamnose 4-epimerase